MNTDGCTGAQEGFFTDEMFVFNLATSSKCEAKVSVWLGLIITSAVLRVATVGLVWYAWWLQQVRVKASKDRGETAKAGRFPLVPFFSTLDTLMMILLMVLLSTNSVSTEKGTSLLVFVIWMSCVVVIQMSSLLKMVHLGIRIFRFDLGQTATSTSSSGQQHARSTAFSTLASSLSTFDSILKTLILLMLVIWTLCIIASIICATTGLDFVWSRVAIASMGLEQTMYYCATNYQYTRCIRVVSRMRESVGADNTGDQVTGSKYRVAFDAALTKMRYQVSVISLTGLCSIAFIVYFLVTLNLYWWLVVACFYLDNAIYFSMVVSFLPCFTKHGRRKDTSNGAIMSETGVGGSKSQRAIASTNRLIMDEVGTHRSSTFQQSEVETKNNDSLLMVRARSKDDIDED